MIKVAIETCCKSIPTAYIIPNVISRVIGMDTAISNAERHSQNPTRETMTTSKIAS